MLKSSVGMCRTLRILEFFRTNNSHFYRNKQQILNLLFRAYKNSKTVVPKYIWSKNNKNNTFIHINIHTQIVCTHVKHQLSRYVALLTRYKVTTTTSTSISTTVFSFTTKTHFASQKCSMK